MALPRWSPLFLLLVTAFEVKQASLDQIAGRSSFWVWQFVKQEVCYQDYGCFSNSYPYSSLTRGVTLLPVAPEVMETRFLLYTRNASDVVREEELSSDGVHQLETSNFTGTKDTKIIIPGFNHNLQEAWIKALIKELLIHEDLNVIVVNWVRGSKWPYMQAVANARLVGAQIARLMNFLIKLGNSLGEKFHLIGHSLGAHIAGYAGRLLGPSLGRISGLDPASVYFDSDSQEIRLDATDAQFVDIIHNDTATIGFGLITPLGHLDFYPNNGMKQPGCTDKLGAIYDSLFDVNAAQPQNSTNLAPYVCSHQRAIDYFIESINGNCTFLATRCNSWKDYLVGKCRDCSRHDSACASMGYHARSVPSPSTQSFYLATSPTPVYCMSSYKVVLNISGLQDVPGRGRIYIDIRGQNGVMTQEMTRFRPLYGGPQTLMAGQEIARFFDNSQDLGKIVSAKMRYLREGSFFQLLSTTYDSNLKVDSVTISKMKLDQDGADQYVFCENNLDSSLKTLNSTANGTCLQHR